MTDDDELEDADDVDDVEDGDPDAAGVYEGWPTRMRVAYAVLTAECTLPVPPNMGTLQRTAASVLTQYLRGAG